MKNLVSNSLFPLSKTYSKAFQPLILPYSQQSTTPTSLLHLTVVILSFLFLISIYIHYHLCVTVSVLRQDWALDTMITGVICIRIRQYSLSLMPQCCDNSRLFHHGAELIYGSAPFFWLSFCTVQAHPSSFFSKELTSILIVNHRPQFHPARHIPSFGFLR